MQQIYGIQRQFRSPTRAASFKSELEYLSKLCEKEDVDIERVLLTSIRLVIEMLLNTKN